MPPAPLNVKTKIVATVGPASESAARLEQLLLAGVDVFRLNFSHGTWDWHTATLGRIQEVSRKLGRPVAVLQDLCGPKLRLGELEGGIFQCQMGARVRLVPELTYAGDELPVSHPSLLGDLNAGDAVMLADGSVALKVVSSMAGTVLTEVTLPGEVRSRQGISFPGARLRLESLTEKDLHDLDWTARHEVDFVGMSFVRRAADIDRLREELKRHGSTAQIIAKIEKAEALAELDAIIERTDAVMVARGDLGVEIDVARVPVVQKEIIQRCNRLGKPVITATQMLESMRTSNRPTRAEASDVANAILDGTDAVMLSAETATGTHPIEAVATMNRIAAETEAALTKLRPHRERLVDGDPRTATVHCAGQLADRVGAKLLIAATHAGHTALALSQHRNLTPTLGLSDQPATVRRMALYWGVLPVQFEVPRVRDEYVTRVMAWAREQALVTAGDRVVFIFGAHWADTSYNALLVHEVT